MSDCDNLKQVGVLVLCRSIFFSTLLFFINSPAYLIDLRCPHAASFEENCMAENDLKAAQEIHEATMSEVKYLTEQICTETGITLSECMVTRIISKNHFNM